MLPLANDDHDIDVEHGGARSPNLNRIPDEPKAAHDNMGPPPNASGDTDTSHVHRAMAEDVPWEMPLTPFPGVIGDGSAAASDHDFASLAGGGGVDVDDSDVKPCSLSLPTSGHTRKSSISQLLTASFKQALRLTNKDTKIITPSRRLSPLQVKPLFSFSFPNRDISPSILV